MMKEYGERHLLSHMQDGGKSDDEIAAASDRMRSN